MIAIVDYGMGNLRSVQKGLMRAGASDVLVTGDADTIAEADGIVLPGVGAFRDAISNLESSGIKDVLLRRIAEDTPFLGICLGMQMLADVGYEDGQWAGLGVVAGRCVRLPEGVKVPHIGWNTVRFTENALFDGIGQDSEFYFVHSYRLIPDDASCIIGSTEHGVAFASAVQFGRSAFAVQFHPEKSSETGLRLLGNFGDIVREVSA